MEGRDGVVLRLVEAIVRCGNSLSLSVDWLRQGCTIRSVIDGFG